MIVKPNQADIQRAREIVKRHYPEMKPDYSGRRVQIVLEATQALQAENEQLRGIIETFSKVHGVLTDSDREFLRTALEAGSSDDE